MSPRHPMSDLVVVVPGITGSVLAIGESQREVWALSGRAIMDAVRTLGRNVQRLRLPEGFGDALPEQAGEGEPTDGVHATKLMADLHVIPGLWSPIKAYRRPALVKGYNALVARLEDWFELSAPIDGQPGNLIEFPYDWRLSNAVSARRLATAVIPALERWRAHTENQTRSSCWCAIRWAGWWPGGFWKCWGVGSSPVG